jgi:hypothetical protein
MTPADRPHCISQRRDGGVRLLPEEFQCEVNAVLRDPRDLGPRIPNRSRRVPYSGADVRGRIDRQEETHQSWLAG